MKKVRFSWKNLNEVHPSVKKRVEESLKDNFNDKINLAPPCHEGIVTVDLEASSSEQVTISGGISCSCGIRYCELSGSCEQNKEDLNLNFLVNNMD